MSVGGNGNCWRLDMSPKGKLLTGTDNSSERPEHSVIVLSITLDPVHHQRSIYGVQGRGSGPDVRA